MNFVIFFVVQIIIEKESVLTEQLISGICVALPSLLKMQSPDEALPF